MIEIQNDRDFKNALEHLSFPQQRGLAARFVEHVLPLSSDDRLNRVVNVAHDLSATTDEIASALKSARAATFDSHARCGSEGDWKEQAGYFVARAAAAAVTPEAQSRSGGPAWQAAMSCRMARTSMLIDAEDQTEQDEADLQYSILVEFLKEQ